MQVQALQGYFDGGIFYQQGQRVALPEHKMVIVNVLDIPVDTNKIKKADIDFWKEFDEMANESAQEELQMVDFPRMNFGREPILFDDEVEQL